LHVLEVALLDGQRPVDELPDPGMAPAAVERSQHLPVPDLARLGHGQELESIQPVRQRHAYFTSSL